MESVFDVRTSVVAPERMIRIRKLVIIVDSIFKHEGNESGFIMRSEKLCEIVGILKTLFVQFIEQHKIIIDPYFQDYSPEVIRGTMDFDPENEFCDDQGKPFITPMGTMMNAIKADMFNQERHKRLLAGPECGELDNRVFIFKELGELFINNNLQAIERLCSEFLKELKK